ncbi:hypothetical protein PBI_SCTP2_455 [Salicola phage SCTP-2]|nr:hypothetical protein PBI_SCTP2_455 [Salicola phage SCTP-2]
MTGNAFEKSPNEQVNYYVQDLNALQNEVNLTYQDEHDINDDGDDVLVYRYAVDDKNRVRVEENYDMEYEVLESSILHYYDEDDEYERSIRFNAEGSATGFLFSKKCQFKRKWDEVEEIHIYSKKHVQRLSISINQYLGEEGRDWSSYCEGGFTDAHDMIDYNQEQTDVNNMVKQVVYLGWNHNAKNDTKMMKSSIKKLNLKFMM